MNYIINRLKERSTWLGIVAVATALGVGIPVNLSEAIVNLGVALAGAIAIFTKD